MCIIIHKINSKNKKSKLHLFWAEWDFFVQKMGSLGILAYILNLLLQLGNFYYRFLNKIKL